MVYLKTGLCETFPRWFTLRRPIGVSREQVNAYGGVADIAVSERGLTPVPALK